MSKADKKYGKRRRSSDGKTLRPSRRLYWNTAVMSCLCSSSPHFYLWQSNINEILNIIVLPEVTVLIYFKIGLCQVNQQWYPMAVFWDRCFKQHREKYQTVLGPNGPRNSISDIFSYRTVFGTYSLLINSSQYYRKRFNELLKHILLS